MAANTFERRISRAARNPGGARTRARPRTFEGRLTQEQGHGALPAHHRLDWAQRLAARTGHACDASDADAGIARQMAAAAAPWPDAVTIDTSQPSPVTPGEPPGPVMRQAMEAIRPHRPEHPWRPDRPVLLPG